MSTESSRDSQSGTTAQCAERAHGATASTGTANVPASRSIPDVETLDPGFRRDDEESDATSRTDSSSTDSIIVFDGVCNFCNGWVKFLLRHDRDLRFRFAAMQSESGRELLAANHIDADDPTTFLLLQGGHAYLQSDAALRVLAGLGWPWRAATMLRLIPAGWRDAAYLVFARNRYRWFGKRDVCMMPSSADRARFLL